MKRISTLVVFSLFVILALRFTGCAEDDMGKKCTLPFHPTSCSNNIAFNDIASDCINHWCLSYFGSDGFCSKTCLSNADCSSGFRCYKGFTTLDPELKNTSFCVPKQNMECIAGNIDAGMNTISDTGKSGE